MRELKFRCWDRVAELYLSNGNWTGINQDGNPWLAVEGKDVLGGPYRWVVEQYTGLKDKNGKEIYEGDIVKCILGNKPIVSHDCRYWLGETLDDLFVANLRYDIEVIGNIHENAGLL